jgi:hypothetical protein
MNEGFSNKKSAPIIIKQEFAVKAGVFFNKNAKIVSLEQ